MAGGFKQFGPTYKSTDIVRLGYEGYLNGQHGISASLVAAAIAATPGTGVADAANSMEAVEPNVALAGKIAAITADGVGLAGDKGAGAVGLFREDLHDMVNASLQASFYFRGGEYYVVSTRTAVDVTVAKIGDKLTTNANGELRLLAAGETDATIVGVVTHIGGYKAGNMYEWAGDTVNGGTYIGFIMYI
jgi:hypothetical protein